MSNSVYITRLARFLPNNPVSNEEMESYLGRINGKPSRSRSIVLRNNKIKTRYYALDKNGNPTHTNARLTTEAIKNLTDDSFELEDMELLACGTTSPDQLLPSHASMVHGELNIKPVEILSSSGGCCSGLHALKFGYLSVLSGDKNNAVCTGSEMLSTWMSAKNFKKESDQLHKLSNNSYIGFEKDFLRWMLSDGACAALLTNQPNDKSISLKIDWINSISYANQEDTCMYAGGEKQADGSLKGWKEFETNELLERSVFSLRQDIKLLEKNIVKYGCILLSDIVKNRKIDLNTIDYFLPHMSSEYFRSKIDESFKQYGLNIPQDKWFTNLTKLGNVGAASVYFMLEELFHSGKLKKGNKILCMTPESARFSYVYSMMTIV